MYNESSKRQDSFLLLLFLNNGKGKTVENMQADGLILAGGKSTRMGGVHKGALMLGNETFTMRLIKEMQKEVQNIWISYGETIHGEYPGCRIVQDEYIGCGPIGGLCAGLRKSRSEIVFAAACDMPFLEMELFDVLCGYLEEDCDGVVPVTDGRIHPLAAVYRKRAAETFEKQILAGQYRLTGALKLMKIRYVDLSGQPGLCRMLENINTMEQYEGVRKWKD